MHWIGAYAIVCMVLSGWEIYDASPSLALEVPAWATLGGWLAGGIAWHLSAMWILFVDGIAYLGYGLATGHFRRHFGRPRPAEVWRDLRLAFAFRLPHKLGTYNAVQRLLYIFVITAILLAVVTGFSIWKPVQFGLLTGLFGGYPTARLIHLSLMAAIVAFIVVHVLLVVLFPRTLVSMVVGLPSEEGHDETPA